jgi:GNAT superfamily N-acetyltransferase
VEVRKATVNDLTLLRRWLQQESDDGHHSFIVNFNSIEAGQENGSLTVLVDDLPIAFALGADNLGILAVKRDRRQKGVGRMLVAHWIQQARDRDLMGFNGECAPRNSLGFWKKMGCQEVESPHGKVGAPWVAMPLGKKRELPPGVTCVPVSFEIFLADDSPAPNWNFSTEAAVIEPDDFMLAEDFVAYVPRPDARVVIRVDKSQVANLRVSDIEKYGGSRNFPWIRVRDLDPRPGNRFSSGV